MSIAHPTEVGQVSSAEHIKQLEQEYLLQNYSRYPLVLHRGKGCYVYDIEGNRYLGSSAASASIHLGTRTRESQK